MIWLIIGAAVLLIATAPAFLMGRIFGLILRRRRGRP